MSATVYASIHHLDATPIKAAASGNEGVEWLTLFLGDIELTVFMPLDRASRLAEAINDAEAAQRAANDAAAVVAEVEAATPPNIDDLAGVFAGPEEEGDRWDRA